MAVAGEEFIRVVAVLFAALGLLAWTSDSTSSKFIKKKVAKAELGSSLVVGALPKDLVVKTINESMGQAELCFFRSMFQTSMDRGDVSLSWTITPEGRASDIRVMDAAPEFQRAADCMRGRLRRWSFPASEGRTEVRQKWSFKLVEVKFH